MTDPQTIRGGPTAPATPGRWGNTAVAALVLLPFVFLINANSLDAFFVGDDYDFLLYLSQAASVADVPYMAYWGEWEPLWWLSWYLDYKLWGIDPRGYHVNNLLWLALSVVALFGFVRLAWPARPLAAWGAALLFATHPVHDEAVTYLAARGHTMAVALALLALWLYARARGETRRAGSRPLLFAAAGLLAVLAALAKETAMTLPAWIAVYEGILARPSRAPGRSLAAGIRAGALFALVLPVALGLRQQFVGLESDKLYGGGDGLAGWLERAADLPGYALLGGLPIPFGLAGQPTVERYALLGWLLLATVLVFGIAALARCAWRRGDAPRASALFGLGLVIAVVGLLPVFWADLPLRRRYLYLPSVGIALMAVVPLCRIGVRFPWVARALLLAAVATGALVTVHRNGQYRESGEVARNLFETARRAPLTETARPPRDRDFRIALVTLPRYYGGDHLSGVYLLHHTDVLSGLWLFDIQQPRIRYALKARHADDYTARYDIAARESLRLTVTFRSRAAFEDAQRVDPLEQRRGKLVTATLKSADPATRTLIYDVETAPFFWESLDLLLYSDGEFKRVD